MRNDARCTQGSGPGSRTDADAIAWAMLTGLLLLAGCLGTRGEMERRTLVFGPLESGQNLTLRVEMARTHEQIRRGLMDRTSLDEGAGMLFDMGDSAIQSFWMYRTRMGLDAVFIDEQMCVLETRTMEPCPEKEAAKCPIYRSSKPARYVLEIPGGSAEREGLQAGVCARWERTDGGR